MIHPWIYWISSKKIHHTKIIFIIIFFYLFKPDNFNEFFLNNKINIGLVALSIKNGGAERSASLISYYFNKVKIFNFFLFTLKAKEKNEYTINNSIERIIVKNNLIKLIKKKKIDILLYQLYNYKQIYKLNKIKHLKIILINRSCFLHWIYYKKYNFFKNYYRIYKNAEYSISLVPFENDYLFRKWGINSILISNFIPYEYNRITPSSLSSNIILMIGRANDRIKRFDLGIKAMKHIISDIPQSEMKIISSLNKIDFLFKLTKDLNLENFVKFLGYISNPSTYYKNASVHLFPTLVEAFPNILSETKIYGIPNVLVGLDYVACFHGGTVNIYDDSPLSIGKAIVKILKNERYKKKLGREARNSMKRFRNKLILKRWIKIILSIYNGKEKYQKLRNKDKKMEDKDAIKQIQNQLKLLKHRNKKFMNITFNNIINFTFMKNLK
jgi:glycosyltransferase involved in cell wall biosynthesis